MTDHSTTPQSPAMSAVQTTGAFKVTAGLMAGVLLGYFLLPLAAPRGWHQSGEDNNRKAFLAQFMTRDEAARWLSETADSLDRKTQYLASLSPPPLERRELAEIRRHLKVLADDPTRRLDAEIMWRARALSEQLVGVPESHAPIAQTHLEIRRNLRPPVDD